MEMDGKLDLMRMFVRLTAVLVVSLVFIAGCARLQEKNKITRFAWPRYVAADLQDNVYLVDTVFKLEEKQMDRVLKMSPNGKLIGLFRFPMQKIYDIAVSRKGNIFLLIGRRKIVKLLPETGKVERVRLFKYGDLAMKRPHPKGLAIDNQENIYVVFGNGENDRTIIKLSPKGRTIAKWQTSEPIADSAGAPIKFITSNPAGNKIYVSLFGPRTSRDVPRQVQVFSNSGSTIGLLKLSTNDATLTRELNIRSELTINDEMLAVDNQGNIYLGLVKFAPDLSYIRIIRPPIRAGEGLASAVGNRYLYAVIASVSRKSKDDTALTPKLYKFTLDGKLLSNWAQAN